MPDLEITLAWGEVGAAIRELAGGNLPHTAEAVEAATHLAQRRWLQVASGAQIAWKGGAFAIRRISGRYAKAIEEGLTYPDNGNALMGKVSANTPYARAIEEGTPPHDMKEALLEGPRARSSKKDGHRYTIVPFRHGTPDSTTMAAMPAALYEQAKKLPRSLVTGRYQTSGAKGQMLTRALYRWGGRLGVMGPGAHRSLPVEHPYTHTTSVFSGMVKMGQARHSQYLTFRVVSDRSNPHSWWHPGTPPRPASEAVASEIEGTVLQILRRGVELDFATIGEVTGGL